MVVMMSGSCPVFHTAFSPVTIFVFPLQFQRHMTDPVFQQFPADFFLDFPGIRIRDNVQGCIVVLPVHAPDMEMMYIEYPVNFQKMFPDLRRLQTVRNLFQKQFRDLFQIFHGIP